MKKINLKKLFSLNNLFLLIVLIGVVVLGIKNFKNAAFLNASLIDLLTIIIAGVIVFFLTERVNDKRRRNDCVEHIILEIEDMLYGESVFSTNRSVALQKQSSCANRIKYLLDAGFSDISKDDLDFISTHFTIIRELYSNHEKDLKTVESDFQRERDKICDKLSKIRISLYK